MNQSLNFIRANRSKSGSCDDSSPSNRSIREYWYPLVEVLTVVVEVVVNSISTDSISKSLIWTTEERNRINERELGKARIPHSDALRCFTTEPHHGFHVSLSHARDKTKNVFLYLFNGLKTYHLCYSITNMTLSTLLILAKCRTRVIMSFVMGLAHRRVSVAQWWSVTRKPHFSWVTRMKWKLLTFTRIRNSKTKRNKRNDRNDQDKSTKTERPKRPKKYTKKLKMIKLNAQGCQALAVIFVSFILCGLLLIYLTGKFSYLSIAISLAWGVEGP